MSFFTFHTGKRKFSNIPVKAMSDQISEDSIDIASLRSLPQKSGSALNAEQTSGRPGLPHRAHL